MKKDSNERTGRIKKQTLETLDPRILESSFAKKLYFISLGCAKNQVDSEIMLYQFQTRGFSLTQEAQEAQVVVINTCSFIESATQESIETIFEAARLKKEGACRALVVTGCFPQRYKKQLAEEMPEVDLFVGTESFLTVAEQVSAFLAGRKTPRIILEPDRRLWEEPHDRILTTSPGSAYLKIAEGCSNHCAYCTIPSIRGPFRSREPKVLIQEARRLARGGVRELILVAQDTTVYGSDLEPATSLTNLLKELLPISAIQWLRLLYLRPERITPELLTLIGQEEKICPYLDIPIQHVSDRILQTMNRPYRQKDVRALIKKIRKIVPQVALRTTLMVGFPGERDKDFQELVQFVSEMEFDHLGVLNYSPEEGTPAAGYADPVPQEKSQARMDRLMEVQKKITLKKNQRRIGSVEPVLVTGVSPESELLIQGRTRFQAPDVDGVVYITDGEPKLGEMVSITITEAHPYDLVGTVVV
ncbi:MAG: 30S ribosomal protein S12 methylthiotransferase RimO [Desulfobacca sp.]|nr:30S ribosomal protein S12 methylthiotransferase RimO [Desulfobacca sp.]